MIMHDEAASSSGGSGAGSDGSRPGGFFSRFGAQFFLQFSYTAVLD